MPPAPRQSVNEDINYLNSLLSNLDDAKQSYITSQTEDKVQNNVNNIEEGYKRIRAYLLEKDIPPAAPLVPEVVEPTLIKYQERHLTALSPDRYEHSHSVPPELTKLNLQQLMPNEEDRLANERRLQDLREAERRRIREEREQARQAKIEQANKIKQDRLNAKQAAEEARKHRQAQAKPPAPLADAPRRDLSETPGPQRATVQREHGTIIRYLVELSDFSDYLRYKISRKAGIYKYCSCCLLSTILLLILLTTFFTAYFLYVCCFGGYINVRRTEGAPGGQIDMSFVKEFRDEFKQVQQLLRQKVAAKGDVVQQNVEDVISGLRAELQKMMQKLPQAEVKIDYAQIQAKINDALAGINQRLGNQEIKKQVEQLQKELGTITTKLDNLLKTAGQRQNIITTDIVNPYEDLFSKYTIINRPTNQTKVIAKQKNRKAQQSIENIYKNRRRFYPGECFAIDSKSPIIEIESVPFYARHLIIAHPEDGDTTVGRQFAPQFITISIQYRESKTSIKEIENAAIFEFKIDGPLFQKFDFADYKLDKYEIVSMKMEFKGQQNKNEICIYEAVVLGDFVQ